MQSLPCVRGDDPGQQAEVVVDDARVDSLRGDVHQPRARLAQELRSAGVATRVREFGIPQEFLPHGGRGELLKELGLTPQNIARYAVEAIVLADERAEKQPTRG